MISYFVQINICWLIFLGFYQLFLNKETFFSLNRLYLITTLTVSLLIPLIPLTLNQELLQSATINLEQVIIGAQSVRYMMDTIVISGTSKSGWSLVDYLFIIYVLGVLISLIRLIYGLSQIYLVKASGGQELVNGYMLVLSEKVNQPFSFFQNIFVHPDDMNDKEMADCILAHEAVHVNESHSFDVIFIEVVACLVWFSPFIYLYKKCIKNIHEYSADASVLKKTTRTRYAEALLMQFQKAPTALLANNFAQTQLQKRITMMKRSNSTSIAKIKYFLAIPALILAMTFASNLQLEAQEDQVKTYQNVINKAGIDGEVYKKVDEMPLFKGCEKEGHNEARQECSNTKLIEHLVAQMKYPEEAKKLGIEGMVVVQFVIDKKGQLKSLDIMKSLDPSCDAEALRVVSTMPDWIPGRQKGEAVNVLFTLPLKFALNDEVETNESPKSTVKTNKVTISKSEAFQGSDPIYKKVDEQPRFPGCEDESDSEAKSSCAQLKMLKYVYANIEYPEKARTAGLEGMVVAQFLVDTKGTTTQFKILRSMGEELDQSVMKMFEKMSEEITWVPGKLASKPVNVEFVLPIRFKLTSENSKGKSED